MAQNKIARAALSAWKLHFGLRPFAEADSRDPRDRSRWILTEASCLLGILGAACSDSQSLIEAGEKSALDAWDRHVLGQALAGVGSLVDFASFLLED